MIQVSEELLQDWLLKLQRGDTTEVSTLIEFLLGGQHDMLHPSNIAPMLISSPPAPIFVSKTQVLEWRKEWMADHPCEDGHDHVTPFDGLLYQHVPYDQHTQRLRGAISNLKWSEVPLAKLEAVAAVLCDVGDDERVERAANAMCYFSTGETMADAWTDREPDYWMELAKISAGVFK